MFIGSYEDSYSPYESSLVVQGKVLSGKSRVPPETYEILENILKGVEKTTFIRLFIHFNFLERDFENLIGKKAHTDLLINNYLMRIIFSKYRFLFN